MKNKSLNKYRKIKRRLKEMMIRKIRISMTVCLIEEKGKYIFIKSYEYFQKIVQKYDRKFKKMEKESDR